MSGNRTRGVCVTGRNVTNYTNTDLIVIKQLEQCIDTLVSYSHGGDGPTTPPVHHSIIPQWIYRIPSELRSQALLGPISTAVGDHAGILGVECFLPFFTNLQFQVQNQCAPEKHRSHHSIIPQWIYRIPSELRSQALLGPISTAVGDHAGILGVECSLFGFTKKVYKKS